MADDKSEGIRAIAQDEHNGDAHAKRVIPRYQDPDTGSWLNYIPPKVAGVDFNYLDVQQTDADTETYELKTGGSGGSTVRTIVINYTDSSKENVDNVSWS